MEPEDKPILDRWLARLDQLLPDGVADGEHLAVLRGRIVAGFTVAVSVYFPVFGLTGLFALDAPLTGGSILACSAAIPATLWLLRNLGPVAAGHLLAATLVGIIGLVGAFNGGPDSQILMAYAMVPLFATGMTTVRGGVLWTVTALVVGVGMYLAGAAGVAFPRELSPAALVVLQFMVFVALLLLVLSLAVVYEFAQVAASAAIAEREAHLDAVVQTTPDALLVLTEAGEVLEANAAATRMFAGETLVGRSFGTLFVDEPELDTLTDVPVSAVARRGGDTFPVELSVASLRRRGQDHLVVTVRDVTAQKRVQDAIADARDRALEASRAKSGFLANMSHELRTPLNAILGYAEMVQEELEDLEQPGLVADTGRILEAGRHLLQLINDVLDLSKIEAGKMVLANESVDLRELLAGVRDTVEPLVSRKNNELEVVLPATLEPVRSDPVRLRQVLLNLLSNASKFTESGRITLTVEQDQTATRLEVADDGIGMSEEQLKRVFAEFVQADGSTTRRFGGTGLGLTISRRLASMMGGTIEVDSIEGEGSTFALVLPRGAARRSAPEPVHAVNAEGEVVAGVLVIDDDAWARDLIRRALSDAGFAVRTAGSGVEGLELARTTQPRVIVLDVIMPGMDGWEVLGLLKDNQATASIPVVMLTMTEDRELGLSLGAAHFLTKPLRRERLFPILRELGAVGHAMIVEDDQAMQDLMARTLSSAGWSSTVCDNGRLGLEALEAGARPDVILLDLMMPEVDGFEFLDRLRGSPVFAALPVIVVTAKELDEAEREHLSHQAQRVLQKSAHTRKELLQQVVALVGQHAGR